MLHVPTFELLNCEADGRLLYSNRVERVHGVVNHNIDNLTRQSLQTATGFPYLFYSIRETH